MVCQKSPWTRPATCCHGHLRAKLFGPTDVLCDTLQCSVPPRGKTMQWRGRKDGRMESLVDRGGTRDDIDGRYKRRLCVTTEAHAGIWGLHCHRKPCWCPWAMLLLRAVWVYGLCCSRGLCWCLGSVLPLETTLRTVACADPADICEPCCCQKSLGSSGSVFLLTVKGKEAPFEWHWWLQTYSWEKGT